MTNFNKLPEVI